jgi:hypothetical protein
MYLRDEVIKRNTRNDKIVSFLCAYNLLGFLMRGTKELLSNGTMSHTTSVNMTDFI